MLRITVSSFICLCLMVISTDTQENTRCVTPLKDPGVCVTIRNCDGLITLLRSQGNDPEVRSYLIRSNCGFSGTTPMVCCPQLESQLRTTQTPPTPFVPVDPVTVPPTAPPPTTAQPRSGDGFLRPPLCGVSNMTSGRIVGGTPAKLGEFPWQVALGYRNNKNPDQPKWLCGGTLITERHILTAGHCVYRRSDLYLARIGELDLYSDNDGATPLNIPLQKAKIHEDYNGDKHTYDIAILTMQYGVDLTKYPPVCLPIDEPQRSQNLEKHQAFVIGWGSLYFNGPSSTSLQKVLLPIRTLTECQNAFAATPNTVIDDNVICAGFSQGGKDACQGDSGGPLMVVQNIGENMKLFHQVGVVSYGFRCAEAGYPGVYTNIPRFVDWIQRNAVI